MMKLLRIPQDRQLETPSSHVVDGILNAPRDVIYFVNKCQEIRVKRLNEKGDNLQRLRRIHLAVELRVKFMDWKRIVHCKKLIRIQRIKSAMRCWKYMIVENELKEACTATAYEHELCCLRKAMLSWSCIQSDRREIKKRYFTSLSHAMLVEKDIRISVENANGNRVTRKYFCLWLVMRKEKVKSDKAAKHWIRCSASYMFQRWTSAISALKLRRHVLGTVVETLLQNMLHAKPLKYGFMLWKSAMAYPPLMLCLDPVVTPIASTNPSPTCTSTPRNMTIVIESFASLNSSVVPTKLRKKAKERLWCDCPVGIRCRGHCSCKERKVPCMCNAPAVALALSRNSKRLPLVTTARNSRTHRRTTTAPSTGTSSNKSMNQGNRAKNGADGMINASISNISDLLDMSQ